MKLYYAPGACSLAPHIILRETGTGFDLDKVDLATKKTESGEDFLAVNPKGYVPALRMDDGNVLTEASIAVQYIADLSPQSGLIPLAGSIERYRVQEWLNFVSAEVHKTLGVLFNPAVTGEWRQNQLSVFAKRAEYLESLLGNNSWLAGDHFSVADAYLFTILGWTGVHGIDLSPWPKLAGYRDRIAARPAVVAAMQAEGLIPAAGDLRKAS